MPLAAKSIAGKPAPTGFSSILWGGLARCLQALLGLMLARDFIQVILDFLRLEHQHIALHRIEHHFRRIADQRP
jgi:hypothetical protein